MGRALLYVAFLFLYVSSCNTRKEATLVIAVAANVQYAMDELVTAFENEYAIPCDIIVGSSGKLTAQIMEGAPYDVFVSADMKYPSELFKHGNATAAPEVYAYGTLVLWSAEERDLTIESLLDQNIRHIAIANPRTAPYGEAAIEVLQYADLYDAVREKLVMGESISQVNQFVASGAAEIGFTAKSIVLSPELKGKGHWIEVDRKAYTPMAQGVVIIANTKVKEEAEKFYTFLFSKQSVMILNRYGYVTPLDDE